tara:strand:+ start:168 stop:1784 length:1617 start_codon:yes stop_codon:yes gene_type:complete
MIERKIEEFIISYLKENEIENKDWSITQNNKKGFGDYSSNIALVLAKILKKSPMDLANNILKFYKEDNLFTVFVTKPGFVNFIVKNSYYYDIINQILKEQHSFGKPQSKNQTANVEFVSCNPTGPLTVGHGRQAILGDMISNILTWNGYNVTREYYYNDAGKQMRILAESCYAKYANQIGKHVQPPENGYVGLYLDEIASKIIDKYGKDLKSDDKIFRDFTEKEIFANIENTLESIGIKFDVFTKEGTFYKNGDIDNVLKSLKDKKLSYEKDGAVWFKTTALGKEEDKVLVKSTGEPTYRLPDIAYHIDKVKRNFNLLVDVFGADHIDTYPDVMLALEALDYKTSHIKIVIHQFVTLKKDGEIVKMSTRKANFVTLDELIQKLSSDIIRYFFIMRGANSHLDFDLDLAMDESEKNPVYYLQYAHARISNLNKRFKKEMGESNTINLELLEEEDEILLIKKLEQFPKKMEQLLQSLEPRQLATYLENLSAQYHKFYGNHKVIDSNNTELSHARMALCNSTQIILKIGFSILGISSPERM